MERQPARLFAKLSHNSLLRQAFSYLIVGGLATLVEWGVFFCLDSFTGLHYLTATAAAFAFSTFANWAFGRMFTFRHASGPGMTKEISAVYLISLVGLSSNLVLMYLFVEWLGVPSMPAKVVSTGLVFFWNFLARKKLLYKV